MTGHMRLGFHAPETVEELAHLVGEAMDTRTPLEVMGRGTKRELGRPVRSGAVVSTESLTGVTLYEPTELVLVVKAGTPVGKIEELLAESDQMLPFEPVDLGPALGYGPGQATVGGMIATNFSGSRRILSGSARDHVLGVTAVNGRGEIIKAGGRVMKNVTGYDLGRALAGSWGTLAIMTEIALKVLPAQAETRTVLCFGLPDATAVEAMSLCSRHALRGLGHGAYPRRARQTLHRRGHQRCRHLGHGDPRGEFAGLRPLSRQSAPPDVASLWARARARDGTEPALLERGTHVTHVPEDAASALAHLDGALESAEARREHRPQDRGQTRLRLVWRA